MAHFEALEIDSSTIFVEGDNNMNISKCKFNFLLVLKNQGNQNHAVIIMQLAKLSLAATG